MTDFEKIKNILIKSGYKLNQHIEIEEFKERKFIYLGRSLYNEVPDNCFEFDEKGNLLEIILTK